MKIRVFRDGVEARGGAETLRRALRGTDLGQLVGALRAETGPPGACPACGWSREQWAQTTLAGCGLCYSVFDIPGPGEPLGGPGSSHPSGIG